MRGVNSPENSVTETETTRQTFTQAPKAQRQVSLFSALQLILPQRPFPLASTSRSRCSPTLSSPSNSFSFLSRSPLCFLFPTALPPSSFLSPFLSASPVSFLSRQSSFSLALSYLFLPSPHLNNLIVIPVRPGDICLSPNPFLLSLHPLLPLS